MTEWEQAVDRSERLADDLERLVNETSAYRADHPSTQDGDAEYAQLVSRAHDAIVALSGLRRAVDASALGEDLAALRAQDPDLFDRVWEEIEAMADGSWRLQLAAFKMRELQMVPAEETEPDA